MIIFLCKQKTAYEIRISDWSSDVCSSDLEESRGTGACTVSSSKEDSDDVAGSGFGKRHLFCQTVDGSTKAANNSNRLIGDRGTEFVRNGYRIVPPDHCAEIAAGCKLVVKAAIDDHECFALAELDRKRTRLNSSH